MYKNKKQKKSEKKTTKKLGKIQHKEKIAKKYEKKSEKNHHSFSFVHTCGIKYDWQSMDGWMDGWTNEQRLRLQETQTYKPTHIHLYIESNNKVKFFF